MFVSCLFHVSVTNFNPIWFSGEPWNPLTFLNIVEVVIDEGTIFNSFEPVKTCQNQQKKTSELTIHIRNNSKILNVSFWRLEMRLCLIPSWTGRKFKVHAMYIILECPMSILRSISATLHFCPEKERFTFACAISSFYENNTANILIYCILYESTIYIHKS